MNDPMSENFFIGWLKFGTQKAMTYAGQKNKFQWYCLLTGHQEIWCLAVFNIFLYNQQQ